MEKLRFTQLFHESEKVLTDEEKFKIILEALPDDEKTEIEENYEAAKFEGKLKDFFEDLFDEYKDILDNAKSEETSEAEATSEAETVNDDADDDSTTGTDLSVNTSNEEADDEVETTDEQDEKEQNKAVYSSEISGGKSKLVITDTYNERIKELLNAKGMEKDFEQYERYFGYTSTGKKDFVEVMFHTPEYWPIKTGQLIKKDDPLFHTVACMNEFLIWKMGVEIYNKNEKIKGIFDAVLKSGKVGSELNSYVKEHWKETWDKLNVAKKEIETGTTPIPDPFERSLEDYQQKNNIIIFMFMKIFPTILKAAKTGKVNGLGSCTAKVLGSDNLYKKLYQIGRGEVDGEIKNGDSLTDLIYDSYYTFLGGRIGVRSFYEDRIRGKALIGTANARPLCVFDDNWTGNKSALAKNVFLKMDTAFSEKNEDLNFNIDLTRKPTGKGATKVIGVSEDAYAAIASGKSIETLQKEVELGEIDQKQLDDAAKAMQFVTTQKIEIEPFTVIASTVASDFRNFLSCMTRVGARKAGVFKVYGKKYWSKDEIDDETNPAKKAKKIEDNKAWDDVKTQILNFKPRSMDTPTTGKDGDTGTTLGDLIADKVHGISEGDKDIVKQNMNALVNHLKAVKTFVDSLPERNIKEISEKINGYYSIICQSRFEYIGLREPRITAKGALNMVVGKQPGSGKNLGQLVDLIPIQKMGNWGLHTDGSGGKPIGGMGGNFNPNEDSISFNHGAFNCYSKVRSLPGLYYINYTIDGERDFNEYVNSLKSLYNYSRSKIFELLEKGGLNIDDKGYGKKGGRIISGQLYAPNEIRDNGEIIERIPISLTSMDVPYTDINDYLVDSPYCQWRIASRAKTMSPAQLRKFRNDPETEDFRNELKKRHDFDVDKAIDTMNKDGVYDKENLNPQGVQLTANPDGGLVFTNSDSDFGNPEIHDNFSMDYVKGNKVRYNQEVNTDNFKVTGGYNKADESMFDFFGEIFREASEKEKTKKQRFTIN